MTAPSPSVFLAQYAHRLQLAAPREWESFVQCFEAYASEVTVNVAHADQNEILQKQGQARAFLHLAQIFRHCATPPKSPPPSV